MQDNYLRFNNDITRNKMAFYFLFMIINYAPVLNNKWMHIDRSIYFEDDNKEEL